MSNHHSLVVPTWLGVVLAAATMLGSWTFSYFANDKQTAVDIATLKAQQTDTTQRLEDIKGEVGDLDSKLDQLIQGLLKGGHGRH